MSVQLETKEFDIKQVVNELQTHGGVSVPILSQETVQSLNQEVRRYRKKLHRVHDLIVLEDFPKQSGFIELRNQFQAFLIDQIRTVPSHPLSSLTGAIEFKDMELLRYNRGISGLHPHCDRTKFLHCIFMLRGDAKFFASFNSDGSDSWELSTKLGNVIMLRGEHFPAQDSFTADERSGKVVVQGRKYAPVPYHFTSDVKTPRLVFGLLQKWYKLVVF